MTKYHVYLSHRDGNSSRWFLASVEATEEAAHRFANTFGWDKGYIIYRVRFFGLIHKIIKIRNPL